MEETATNFLLSNPASYPSSKQTEDIIIFEQRGSNSFQTTGLIEAHSAATASVTRTMMGMKKKKNKKKKF